MAFSHHIPVAGKPTAWKPVSVDGHEMGAGDDGSGIVGGANGDAAICPHSMHGSAGSMNSVSNSSRCKARSGGIDVDGVKVQLTAAIRARRKASIV